MVWQYDKSPTYAQLGIKKKKIYDATSTRGQPMKFAYN